MSILPIIKYPNPGLSKPALEVAEVTPELQLLADNMLETMYNAPGIGLAAPQVGESVRLIVLDVDRNDIPRCPVILFNPRIVEQAGEQVYEEGCLSVPNYLADVIRAQRVLVEGIDREAQPLQIEGEGLLAICLQHEIDHLDGKLFLDRISPLKRALYRKRRLKELDQAS